MGKRKTKAAKQYGKGSAEWVGHGDKGCYHARVSVPGQPRERVKLYDESGRPLDDREGDRALALKLTADISKRLRSEDSVRRRQERGKRMTVEQLGTKWTSGELLVEHGEVNRLRELASVDSVKSRLSAHVYPVIGAVPVEDVVDGDIREVMRKAAERSRKRRGKPMRGMTAVNLYNALHRLFELAIEPCRLRKDNPVSPRLKPSKGKPKIFGFVYPAEMLQLLGCEKVPIARRVLYALAAYTGLRASSLYGVRWGDIDFTNGTLLALRTKNGHPQMFEIGHGLPQLLERWHAYQGRPKVGAIVEPEQIGRVNVAWGKRPDGSPWIKSAKAKGREAEALRADLIAAGVDRAQLFDTDAVNVEPIRFHDLRGTFVTWAKREGRGDGWISDRTGHLSTDMIRRYERQARVLADLRYEPFPDISAAIPELAEFTDNVVRLPVQSS